MLESRNITKIEFSPFYKLLLFKILKFNNSYFQESLSVLKKSEQYFFTNTR